MEHVILFDFPRDGVEYVRRVGRATRGSHSPGRVTSLVLGRQLQYARALMKVNREGGNTADACSATRRLHITYALLAQRLVACTSLTHCLRITCASFGSLPKKIAPHHVRIAGALLANRWAIAC